MQIIQLSNQSPLQSRDLIRLVKLPFEIQHRRTGRAESRALIHRRQIAGLPVLRAVDRQALGIVQHDVGRQVLVHAAQGVGDPRAHGRLAREHSPAVHLEKRRLVGQIRGEHRADHGDVVDAAGQMRHGIGDPGAALSVAGELKRAAKQRPGRARVFHLAGDLVEIRLAVQLVQQRLGVEQIHLARPAIHEQVDHAGRRGPVMRWARLQVINPALGMFTAGGFARLRVFSEPIARQQRRQRRPKHPAADRRQKPTSICRRRLRRRCSCSVVHLSPSETPPTDC